MYSKCTLCGSGWKNPKRMAAHCSSSCHRLALTRCAYVRDTLSLVRALSGEVTRCRRENPQLDVATLQEEMRCRFIDRCSLLSTWYGLYTYHLRFMRHRWVCVVNRLRVFTVSREILAFLPCYVETRKRKRDICKNSGNLKNVIYTSPEESTLGEMDISSRVLDLTFGVRNFKPSMDSVPNAASHMYERTSIVREPSCYRYGPNDPCSGIFYV